MGLRVWWQAVQPHSFLASAVPVALGAVIAWTGPAVLDLEGVLLFLLTLLGVLTIHAATNMHNDYVDFRRGVDDLPPELVTPFTGGSRVLPDGLTTPSVHRRVFVGLYGAGILVGLALALLVPDGWIILALGWTAGPLTILYTQPPVSLQYRGLGEGLVGVVFGPVLVFGAFYVQAATLAWEPVVASVPLGLLVAAFLLINEIPERETDPRGGKRTLPARMAVGHSVGLFAVLVAAAFLWVPGAVILGLLPGPTLLGLVAGPLGVQAVAVLRRTEGQFPDHLPANGLTILSVLLLGLLLMAGYALTAALAPAGL